METLPRKTSLVAQTRSVLLDGIQAQRWVGRLPGERVLGRELQVSRWTLRAALDDLARNRVIRVRQGHACEILRSHAGFAVRPAPRSLRVALVTPQPLPQLRQFASLWVDELRRVLHEQNISLDVLNTPRLHQARPERTLSRMVAASPHDAWILLLSPQPVQAWFQREELPAVVAGSCSDEIGLPSVDADFRSAGVHAGHVLLRAGHRRIAWLVPPVSTAGLVACEAGLRSALHRCAGEASLAVLSADGRENICRALDRSLATLRPTGILCAKAGATLTTLCHLASKGVHVPRDVSVLSIEAEPFFEHLAPSPSHYAISPTLYARRVARLVVRRIGTHLPTRPEWLELSYVAGESVGRAPATAVQSR